MNIAIIDDDELMMAIQKECFESHHVCCFSCPDDFLDFMEEHPKDYFNLIMIDRFFDSLAYDSLEDDLASQIKSNYGIPSKIILWSNLENENIMASGFDDSVLKGESDPSWLEKVLQQNV